MSTATEEQIEWIKQQIVDQVDAGVEQFTVLESGDSKLLEFSRVVVDSIVGKIDVQHVLNYFYHLQDNGDLPMGKDRIDCVSQYLYDWIALELARRYA